MSVKNLLVVLVFVSLYMQVFSIDTIGNKIDSLHQQLKISDFNNKARILNKLADAYLDISLEESANLSRQALKNSIENENYREEANAYINLANASWYTGIVDSVLYYYTISLNIYEEAGDSSGIADSFNRIALVHEHTGDYDKSIKFMLQALAIYGTLGMLVHQLYRIQRIIIQHLVSIMYVYLL